MTDEFKPFTLPGILHKFTPTLHAFEFARPAGSPELKGTIACIGGLGDNLLGTPVSRALAGNRHLAEAGWNVIEIGLASAGRGWGVGSVATDAENIASLLHHLNTLSPRPTVLIGHSTGSNDLIQLFTRSPSLLNGSETTESLPLPIGLIFLGAVSDREWAAGTIPADAFNAGLEECKKMVAEGKGEEIVQHGKLPLQYMGMTDVLPVKAKRWLSLTAKLSENKEGEDFFSSDASPADEDSVWGELAKQYGGPGRGVHVISAGEDEFYHGKIGRAALVERWKEAWVRGGGRREDWAETVVAGADHCFTGHGERETLVEVMKGWVLGLAADMETEEVRERENVRPIQ
ncbi:DUF1749-domain-containing protein [Ascobolus immersus RN42]|uniref:DUF1749-domain-containing protein n=1 Tax=Ascobolus immersus RN42 TaxID=1160509 RepID=A0A3N4HM04_ASCIM|nr:DUF1749-domain-containing protein [Ascobolus immersus RN42]